MFLRKLHFAFALLMSENQAYCFRMERLLLKCKVKISSLAIELDTYASVLKD